ncbi:MAG: DUF21 domain-containing protein, partial [Chitinophagaceae bacterium]
MIQWNSIVFFILTLLLMGFFAGIEMAFFSANRLSLEIKKKQGDSSMHILSGFLESPARFLGTTLLGFNIFLVFLGLQISTVMQPIWKYFRIGSDAVHILVEIALATFMVLLIAEFIPRAIFRAKSNWLLLSLARVTNVFYQLLFPIAAGLIDLAEWILKYVFNIRLDKNKEALKRSDLKHLFQQRTDDDRQERNTQLM